MSRKYTIEISRKELFEAVWTTPGTRIALKYGISDVGLAKICKRNQIPRPPSGYWAKIAAGQKIPRPRLPRIKNERPVEITTLTAVLGKEEPGLLESATEKIAFEKRPENLIQVPEKLLDPHPRVKAIKQELRTATKHSDGLYRSYFWPGIAVTKPLIPRALLVMDTLLKALEERGHNGEDVRIFDEPVYFQIREHLQSRMTEYAKEKRKEPDFYRSTGDYERIPSGRLQLSIQSPFIYSGDGLQLNWTDAKTQRVEELLNSFICGLIRRASVDRERTLERARERREQETEQRRLAEIARLKKAKQLKKDQLRADAQSWARANILRQYIDAVIAEKGPIQPGSKLEAWVVWAKAEADMDDPILNNNS